MKWTSCLAIAGVAASLAAVPVVAQAQDADRPASEQADSSHRMHGPRHGPMGGHGRAMMMNPAERLLAHREQLNLTPDQVTRLEQIRDTYTAREKPYVEQMQQLRTERQKARERVKASPEVQAAMDSLRASREAARNEARAVLTDEQREKARELMKEQGERRPREMRRQRDGAGTRGA